MYNFLTLQLDHSNLKLFYRCTFEVHTFVQVLTYAVAHMCARDKGGDHVMSWACSTLYNEQSLFLISKLIFSASLKRYLVSWIRYLLLLLFWDYRFFEMLREFLYGFWKLNPTPNAFPGIPLGVESSPQSPPPSFPVNFFATTIIDSSWSWDLKLLCPGFIILCMYCSGEILSISNWSGPSEWDYWPD